MEQSVVVQLAIGKHSVLGSSRPILFPVVLRISFRKLCVCCMNRDSEGASFYSCSKHRVLYTSVMALACDLLSFWHEFDLRIKLTLIPHPSGNCMVFPLHFLNGLFTTKPQLNDHVSHLQDLELNVPSVNQ